MVLIRSTFWLVVAFMVIGPRVDIPASIADLSKNATQGTKSFVEQQTDISTCKSIDCVGTRIVLSAGAQAVSNFVTPLPLSLPKNAIQEQSTAKESQLSPHPRPRILRTS
ncbi:MAG: hypothetical protein L3J21_00780 [Devosiaceae bacterium]|nr:hypothetical protein [Devosiaceae bacterium]